MAEWVEEAPVIEHDPSLYRFDKVATGGVNGFDAITAAHIQQFHDEGFLVIHNAFSADEVAQTLQGLLDLIDGKNPEYKGLQFEQAAAKRLGSLSSEEKQNAVRKVWMFANYDARLKAMTQHPKLVGVIERIMGEPSKMFQDMALLKPPKIGREKPWHQDCAYFNIPTTTCVVGAWIALDEATAENGCMHIIPRSHREGPKLHFQRRDWQICDNNVEVARDTIVPLAPGGCLLFHGLMQHGTPTNHSESRRRAVQFHYKPVSCADTTKEARLAVYGSEGKDVQC
jgi:phytanoyl-CoA hydroxylase